MGPEEQRKSSHPGQVIDVNGKIQATVEQKGAINDPGFRGIPGRTAFLCVSVVHAVCLPVG